MFTRVMLHASVGIMLVIEVVTPSSGAERAVVRGQALYRERIALPPGSVFEATLEDVSRADAKAAVLGTFRAENAGPVPIRFEIAYDPKAIDERHSYSVRGRILIDGRLLFTTDTASPVLTRGHGNEVELLLVRVRDGTPTRATPLEGTHWTLVELDGKPIPSDLPQEAYLVLEEEPQRVSGSGGCNQLTGAYERDGERLRFKQIASTRKACIQGGMDTETSFFAVLDQTRGFRISGRGLELVDDTRRILALFAARDPRVEGDSPKTP